MWDSPTSSNAFKVWTTALRQDCSRREKQARATGVAASSSWPTPTASDAGYFPELLVGPATIHLSKPLDIADGSCGQYAINTASRSWTLLWLTLKALGVRPECLSSPSSPPVLLSFKHGPTSSTAGLISNPQFYEHLMGWPIGWTDPEVPVTEFAVWLQRSRGQLSKLLSMRTAKQALSGELEAS
nr:hypothetical protein [Sphingomonas cavernae]